MKRRLLILISASAMLCLAVGGCVKDILFFVAPFLT
jgi:hypothetical protein